MVGGDPVETLKLVTRPALKMAGPRGGRETSGVANAHETTRR